MSKKSIHIGVEGPEAGFTRFVEAWKEADRIRADEAQVRLNFEDLSMLLALLTPKRVELLKVLRRNGASSIRELSKRLNRDYKNVHADAQALMAGGLIEKTDSGSVIAPWDVIDAHLNLVA